MKVKRLCLLLCVSAISVMALCGGAVRAWAAPAATTTTLAVTSGGSTVTTVAAGSVVTLTATVKAGAAAVTIGQVKFCDAFAYCTDIHLLGTEQLTSAGTAVLKFIPGVGSHSYRAVFLGTTSNAGSASSASPPALEVTSTKMYPTTTTIAQSGSAGGYTLTATVTGTGGLEYPTGTVSFLDTSSGNAVLGTAALGTGTAVPSWTNSQTLTGVHGLIAVGDFNGDGIPDMAVVSPVINGSNTVTILLGKGDGTFTQAANSPMTVTGTDPSSIVVGDFNGDDIPDLAVANNNSDMVTILLGKGDGTFTASLSPATGTDISSIAVEDFNGDGIQDLAVAGNGVTFLLGKGDGTFTLIATNPAAFLDVYSVVVGDFNGDGIPDLAVINAVANQSNGISVFLGAGNGGFTWAVSPAVGTDPSSMVVGDFNGDGIPDLAVVNSTSQTVTVLLGNGDGTFKAAGSPVTGYDFWSIVVGDFNGDGIPDLALGGNSDTVMILLGKGDGTFTEPTQSQTAGYGPIAVGDFNGDGIPDLAVTAYGGLSNNVTAMLSQLNETVKATANSISPVGYGTHMVEASYPGDSNYNSSISSTTGLTAQKGTPTVTVTPASSSITTVQALSVTVTVGGTPTPTGSVTLTSGSYATTATTLSSGSATINVSAGSLATGSDTLTASYTPDSNSSSTYSNASGTSAAVTVTSPASSNFTVSGTAVTLAPGATTGNTSNITVTPAGGFTGSVALTASVTSSPAGAQYLPSLSFGSTSPASITGTSAGTATLTITTTAATSAALVHPKRPGVPWYAAGGATLACILLFGIPARRRSWQTMLGMVALLVALTGGVLACGGGGSTGGGGTKNPGTTAGTYTVTVTGTSVSTTATGTVTLTVQ